MAFIFSSSLQTSKDNIKTMLPCMLYMLDQNL
jgi:hypothetical protein